MAYTRHTWQSGEVISSALLNNIEDGIEEAASSGGGTPEPIIFNATMDSNPGDFKNVTCNYTYDQIKEMSQNPTMPLTATVIIRKDDDIFSTTSGYSIETIAIKEDITFSCIVYGQTGPNQYSLLKSATIYHSDDSIEISQTVIMTNDTDDSGETGGQVY